MESNKPLIPTDFRTQSMLGRDETRSGGADRRHSIQASSDFHSIIRSLTEIEIAPC